MVELLKSSDKQYNLDSNCTVSYIGRSYLPLLNETETLGVPNELLKENKKGIMPINSISRYHLCCIYNN